jgi:hypothetical protein
MQPAAVMFLNGIDPVGQPYLATRDPLVREVWHAVGIRAARIMEKGR